MIKQPRSIKIGRHRVGPDAPPFIIAEMSGNHNQSLERALLIVKAAAKAGAHALKLQTYTADTMTLDISDREFFIKEPHSLWRGTSLYRLYQKAFTPWEWHKPIFDLCKKLGMVGFSTPFDSTAVDFLESLDVPCYKIASFENIDLPLIRKVAPKKKPLIISTGMATLAELDDTVKTARKAGCKDLILLKCTSAYPASPKDCHLMTITDLQKRYGCHVGLSDHTLGNAVSLMSVGLGSVAIERHVTLSRSDGGVDSTFSLEPQELESLVSDSTRAWQAMGHIHYGPTANEKSSLIFRRSLYVTADMNAGDVFTPMNLRAIRPGMGLPPKHYDAFLGKRIKQKVKKGTPLRWSLI